MFEAMRYQIILSRNLHADDILRQLIQASAQKLLRILNKEFNFYLQP